MRFTNNLVKRFGSDKLLHFLAGGWCVSLASTFGSIFMIIVTVALVLLSVYKEFRLDIDAEIDDLLACVAGMGIAWIIWIVGYLLPTLLS